VEAQSTTRRTNRIAGFNGVYKRPKGGKVVINLRLAALNDGIRVRRGKREALILTEAAWHDLVAAIGKHNDDS
jgi:hypothetical protein